MPIRVLALALIAGASLAQAAPPKSQPPQTDAANAQQSAESLDVDAMARAKDAGTAPPADADAPAQTPPPEAPPADTPPATETAPAQAPAAPPSQPAEPPPAIEAAPAAPAAPSTPATEKMVAAPADSPADAAQRSIAASCVARATSLLDDAQKNDFDGATRDFDAKMRTDMPAPKLKQQWDSLAQFGPLVARGQSHLGSGQGYMIVLIPLIFEKTNLVAQIACGSDGRIAGFHITQVPTPKS